MSWKSLRTYLVITIVSVTVGLLLSEIYVRLTGDYWALYRFRERSLQYEPSLFARNVFPRKSQKAQRDPDVHYRINRHGFRGDSFPMEKPPGTLRIMVYGGSAVFDILSNVGRDWPHRLERRLNQKIDSNVHVINAGVPGHASFDSFGRFWTEGYRFEPDYVLIYHAWNDIKTFHTSRPLLRRFDPAERGSHIRLGDPRITYQNALDRFFGQWSQLYLRLRLQYYERKLNLGAEGPRPSPTSEDSTEGSLAPEAIGQFQVTLANFVDAIRNVGATPILVLQARLVTSDNTKRERDKIGYSLVNMSHATLVKAFQRTDRIVRQVSRKKNVSLIDASTSMIGRSELFHDHVHVTDTGSRILARLTAGRIAEFLKEDSTDQ